MAIDSCDHGEYIVNYEVAKRNACPVCKLVSEHEAEVQSQKEQIEQLESELE